MLPTFDFANVLRRVVSRVFLRGAFTPLSVVLTVSVLCATVVSVFSDHILGYLGTPDWLVDPGSLDLATASGDFGQMAAYAFNFEMLSLIFTWCVSAATHAFTFFVTLFSSVVAGFSTLLVASVVRSRIKAFAG